MVVPSRIGPRNQTEGLPTVIVEAFAHQRPVIAARLTGIPEIVIHGVTGWLFEVDDTHGLARALEEVRQDPEEAQRRALRGSELVVSQFDQTKNADALLSMIDSSIDADQRT
jgi:glycosyltransferase involved in cell wall biosynthesis